MTDRTQIWARPGTAGVLGVVTAAMMMLLVGLTAPLLAQDLEPPPPNLTPGSPDGPIVEATTAYGTDGVTLAALCRHLGLSPEATQVYAVTMLDQRIVDWNLAPRPVTIGDPSDGPPAVTSRYQGADADALERVATHFSLSNTDAQRLAVAVEAFLSKDSLVGAEAGGRSCGPVIDVGANQLPSDDLASASGSAPYQRVCWSNPNQWVPDSESRPLRVRVRVSEGAAVPGTADLSRVCVNFERGYVGPYEIVLDYLAYPFQPFESTVVTGSIVGDIDLSEAARPLEADTNITSSATSDTDASDTDASDTHTPGTGPTVRVAQRR